MKTRLALFVAALLLLPSLALVLAGLDTPAIEMIGGIALVPVLLTLTLLASATYAIDALSFRRSGNSLLRSQWHYIRWLSIAGAAMGALIAYLNIFVALWLSPLDTPATLILVAMFGAVALPSVLIVRFWLAGIFKLSRRIMPLFSPTAEALSTLSLLAALTGLLGGPIWPAQLAWLWWLSPLLLLLALQTLWHESTVFSGIVQGDWSRVLLGSAAGILIGITSFTVFHLAGGAIYFTAPVWGLISLCALFGLTCLQLSDVIAEYWRGKTRGEVFKKKPFPIPVVTKK
jgi:hypothetical protein